MGNMAEKQIKPVKRIDIRATLRLMSVGDSTYLLFRDAKPNSIRQAARALKPKKFEVSEAGQVDRTIINRLK